MSCWGVGALCKDGPGWHCSLPQLGCAVPRMRAWGLQKNSIPSASKLGESSLLLLVRLGEVGKLLLLGETIPRKSLLNAGKRARDRFAALASAALAICHAQDWLCFFDCRRREMLVQLLAQGHGGETSSRSHGPWSQSALLDPNHSCWPWQEAVSCA